VFVENSKANRLLPNTTTFLQFTKVVRKVKNVLPYKDIYW